MRLPPLSLVRPARRARWLATSALATGLLGGASPPAEPGGAPASTPTASQVMQRAIDAVGPAGDARFVRVEGTVDGPDGHSTIEMLATSTRPARLVIRQRLADGRALETGCDGEVAWMRSPRDGSVQPLECAAVLASGAGLLPTRMMFALADRFPIRTLAPRETREGRPCDRLELEDRDGARASAWFDVATGRLIEIRTPDRAPGSPPNVLRVEAWTTVGALTLPTTISARKGDAVTRSVFTRVSLDPIADAAFAPPPDLPRPAPRDP